MSEKIALNELESGELLRSCGINMVRSVTLRECGEETLRRTAEELGFPVAMKVLSDDILHKTDVGGVRLHVGSTAEMKEAYESILEQVSARAPEARIQGVLVQQMLPKGLEVLLGVSTDPQFGHVIMVGLGGVMVELLKAVSLRILPIRRRDALEMIRETPLGKVCEEGLRGVRYDREELVGALLSLSRLIEEHPEISEVDLNPLVLFGEGRAAVGVDAMVIKSVRGT